MIEVLDIQDGDRGKNYPKESDFLERGHTIFLNASNVTTSGFAFQDNQYVTEEKSNSMGNGKLYEDDIVITSRGSLGHVAWYNTDIAKEIPFARINSGMLILRNKSDINTSYMYQFMKSDKGQIQISFISFGSAQSQLTKKGMENLTIIFPKCIEEQERLGCYFTNLDHLITLHQCEP
ncbi:EcoKI restriction-modification system protein HsdS [Clostridium sp. C105KSO13]|nr:EcoKI restriction-modification system protein HsdS [Clostridium sp. C105KSO13]